ncbi:MAG: hypothetical protein HQ567_06115 [Candidatus Nealsonbacteria bacterium]|nr:hypothetical protein [Candidatus Nealsonbacteria bacterium]
MAVTGTVWAVVAGHTSDVLKQFGIFFDRQIALGRGYVPFEFRHLRVEGMALPVVSVVLDVRISGLRIAT